ncbi:2Fe-2S iron-sulfur cluster-binding protein [Parasalinivibrio latis]|uniref:2Fe-2S iron-sulfur cluster-binding protein n=1 Tax=Parasalinivibrio latis TaxID=2952610 RepID=UPI0030E10561
MFKISLLPSGFSFYAEPETSVLDAALSAGVAFPHRCMVGACASCLCKKRSGEIEYQLEPLLTEKEKEQGWIFACQAYARSDLVLELEESHVD